MQQRRRHAVKLDLVFAASPAPVSRRVRHVCWQFGLTGAGQAVRPYPPLRLPLAPGQITLVAGPSGAGKSATLRQIAGQLGGRAIWVERQTFSRRRAIVDEIAPRAPVAEALALLASCGLGEARLWLRRYEHLSEGERFRARLAKAASTAAAQPESILLADEFCATLHRRLACAVALNLRKCVSQSGLCLLAATSHDDLLADLRPDQVLRIAGPRPGLEVVRSRAAAFHDPRRPGDPGSPENTRGGPISLQAGLRIEPGSVADYRAFEPMHYRQRDGLGPVDRIFVLRDGGDEPLGIIVYGYPPLALRLRNQVTGGAYHRDGRALNRDFRILRRLVVHPDLRGCGLGHWLVARTLPQVGTRYVECLAAMGAVNPVFERAGMVRIGTAGLPEQQRRQRDALRALGVDPLRDDFARQIASRSAVRRLVARSVHAWLRGTTGRPVERILRMTPRAMAAAFVQLLGAAPVYYLWSGDSNEMERLRSLAAAPRGPQHS